MKMRIKTPDDLAQELQAAARARAVVAARAYLAETDWMVIRAAETGKSVPDGVAEARTQARQTISST